MSHVTLEDLFKKYQLTPAQINAFNTIKTTKNMPDFFKTLSNEELIWSVCVATFDMPKDEKGQKLHPNDIKFYNNKVEERVRKLEEAEKRFGWFTKNWTKPLRYPGRSIFRPFGSIVFSPIFRKPTKPFFSFF